INRARNFAQRLDTPIAIVDKRRQKANECEVMNIIGDVSGKDILIYDDMVDTAGTLCNAARAIKAKGAKSICACATHAVLSGPAIERIIDSPIEELVMIDTIAQSEEKKIDKIKILSCAPVFAEAIARIYSDKPISPLVN
ncbi:MAG: ribose-phosphate diphosphokinase, partial [Oscillospiraceae bacterium]